MKFSNLTCFAIGLTLSFQVFSQAYIPAESQRRIDHILSLLESDQIHQSESFKTMPLLKIDGEIHVSMMAKAGVNFSEKSLPGGVIIASRSGHILSLKVPLTRLKEIQK